MKKHNSGSYTDLCTFRSPEMRNSWDNNVTHQRGWSSERIAQVQPSGGSRRRNVSVSAFTPFYSGRTLPSKWDDAERWICSPVTGNGFSNKILQPQMRKRPKSKSGPIDPPGFSNNPYHSPAIQVTEGSRNFMVGSPLSTGVFKADGVSISYVGGVNGVQSCTYPLNLGTNIDRLGSAPRWSDILSESSLPSSQDEKHEATKDAMDSCAVSRRDMATQMSPEGKSSCSSSFSSPTLVTMVEPQIDRTFKLEGEKERDVLVDQKATALMWSKEDETISSKKSPPDLGNLNGNVMDTAEAAIEASKLQRKEAKIKAWENLQKAKAEAAIRKLEMKLEKQRSSSTEKILRKLRKSQLRAHQLLKTLSIDQSPKGIPNKISSRFQSLSNHIRLRGCFSCHSY